MACAEFSVVQSIIVMVNIVIFVMILSKEKPSAKDAMGKGIAANASQEVE